MKKVLLTPGSYYEPWQGEDKITTHTRGGEKGVGYFRLAYSMVTVRNQIPFTAEILTSTTERTNESRGREDGGGAQSSILGEFCVQICSCKWRLTYV